MNTQVRELQVTPIPTTAEGPSTVGSGAVWGFARNVDPQLIEMGRTYGLSRWQLYREVILPGALSSILVGLRFSLGLMWVILIVAETISAQAGIGYLTMNAREFLQTDIVLVGILLYALLGKLADVFARGLEQWWLRWHPGYQKKAA